MKRILPFLMVLVVALVAACHPFKTETYTCDETMVMRPDSSSTLTISISVDYPVKGASEEALAAMTREILTAAFDLEDEDPTTMEETAGRYVASLKDNYLNENPEAVPTVWEDSVTGFFSGKYGPFRSYTIDYSTFTGGVHGLNTWTPLVFDMRDGALVTEQDFFVDGYAEPVSELLRKDLMERPEEDSIPLFDLWAVAVNGCYEPGEDGVTWYFQPYEIAPYAYGVIAVTLPWASLKEYVREIEKK